MPINAILSGQKSAETLFPDFDKMTPVKTLTFNVSSTSTYEIGRRSNSGLASAADFDETILMRITVTGSNIDQATDLIIKGSKALSNPMVYAYTRTASTTSTETGIKYLYFRYPNDLNSGKDWLIDFACNDSAARTVTVELFVNDVAWTWKESLVASSYSSSDQSSATLTVYTYRGLIALGTQNIVASNATNAGYFTSAQPAFANANMPVLGEVATDVSLLYLSKNNKLYRVSNKTKPINPEAGIFLLSTAVASGSAPAYKDLRQKTSWTTLNGDSPTSFNVFVKGSPLYLRCTLDANNNILSDAYIDTAMRAGYTWCYIGVGSSASSISLDTSHCIFLTLDEDGKLTHINGKEIATSGIEEGLPTLSSAGVYSAIGSSVTTVRPIDSTPTSGSTNPVSSGGVYTALQNIATIDATPTANSTNAVSSGGVYAAIIGAMEGSY